MHLPLLPDGKNKENACLAVLNVSGIRAQIALNPGTCNEIIFGHFLSNLRLSCVPNIPTKVALADAANAEALGHGQQRSVYSL